MKKMIITLLAICSLSSALTVERMGQSLVDMVASQKMETTEYLVDFKGPKLRSIGDSLSKQHPRLERIEAQEFGEVSLMPQKSINARSVQELLKFPTEPSQLRSQCVQQAVKDLRHLGPEGKFESVDVEYTEGTEIGTRVTRVFVRYKRIVNGSTVRDGISFAYAVYSGDGKLERIQARWPDLSALPADDDSKTSVSSSFSYLDDELDRKMVLQGTTRPLSPVRARVKGFSKGLMPVREGGKVTLTPTYTYHAEIELEDGAKFDRIVDYPVLSKRLK